MQTEPSALSFGEHYSDDCDPLAQFNSNTTNQLKQLSRRCHITIVSFHSLPWCACAVSAVSVFVCLAVREALGSAFKKWTTPRRSRTRSKPPQIAIQPASKSVDRVYQRIRNTPQLVASPDTS